MISEGRILELTRNEVLNETTYIHQLENGTIFYRDGTSLWVKHNGKKIEITLPGGFNYSIMAAFGDSLYYGSNWKRMIYKVDFKPPDGIQIRFVRDMLEHENLHPSGMCSLFDKETRKAYVYRICDEPARDGFNLDMIADKLAFLELIGKMGNTAILRKLTHDNVLPEFMKIGKNIAVLACNRGTPRRFMEIMSASADMTEYYPPWGSPAVLKDNGIIYMSNGESLFVLDIAINSSPVRGKMLPPLHFSNVSAFHIAGIHDGLLTGRGKCKKTGKFFMMTAQLPPEYMEKDEDNVEELATMVSDNTTPRMVKNEAYYEDEETMVIGDSSPAKDSFSSRFTNDFEVEKLIGHGSFGCVFRVTSKTDRHKYAVKRVAVRKNDKDASLNEVRAMANLDHAHIVRYNYSWIEDPPVGWQNKKDDEILQNIGSDTAHAGSLPYYNDDCVFLYIQMQLCNYSLSKWLELNQLPSSRNLSRIKTWFKQIVSAVGYIHAKNLIHRDLKPDNILFLDDDCLKLCDLGIVTERKDIKENRTVLTRTMAGTGLYMSPEQLSIMSQYGSQSDVFTLGLILTDLCVVMTSAQRKEVFDGHRKGKQSGLISDERTAEFVKMLTQVEPSDRPTCQQMLDHAFFETDTALPTRKLEDSVDDSPLM